MRQTNDEYDGQASTQHRFANFFDFTFIFTAEISLTFHRASPRTPLYVRIEGFANGFEGRSMEHGAEAMALIRWPNRWPNQLCGSDGRTNNRWR